MKTFIKNLALVRNIKTVEHNHRIWFGFPGDTPASKPFMLGDTLSIRVVNSHGFEYFADLEEEGFDTLSYGWGMEAAMALIPISDAGRSEDLPLILETLKNAPEGVLERFVHWSEKLSDQRYPTCLEAASYLGVEL